MIYFIADPHFGHYNILALSKRPFDTIEAHDEALIRNWNKTVKNSDDIYLLGDLTLNRDGQYANSLLQQLNGRIHLVTGNHEKYLDSPDFDKSNYVEIVNYKEINYQHVSFILFHYPILEWNNFFKPSIHLYGHVHNTRQDYFQSILNPRAINVGVDMINFKPISIDEILSSHNPEYKAI